MGDIRASHMLDENLREACGLDGLTGRVVDSERAALIGEYGVEGDEVNGAANGKKSSETQESIPKSFIEKML
eukprot:9081364-Ditylum_brightwellii.AAC.1